MPKKRTKAKTKVSKRKTSKRKSKKVSRKKVTTRTVTTRTTTSVSNPSDRGLTQKQVRVKLDNLASWQKPMAYLHSTESYDVSSKGDTKAEWIREAASVHGYEPYIVEINFGSSYTSAAVVVLAGHPDGALETAHEWFCTHYYDSDPDKCDEARGAGEGVVSVQHLMEAESNPRRKKVTKRMGGDFTYQVEYRSPRKSGGWDPWRKWAEYLYEEQANQVGYRVREEGNMVRIVKKPRNNPKRSKQVSRKKSTKRVTSVRALVAKALK